MRFVLALVLAAATATAQARQDTLSGYELRVRAADSTQQATMAIDWTARVFSAIGGVRGTIGGVSVGPSGGTGYGTVVATLSKGPGRLTFTATPSAPVLELTVTRRDGAAVPRLVARGRVVEVSVDADGEPRVSTRP